ncbi:hypothetical protein TNIN_311971 [Trichonephila inaurata madagascariensis]|uniref:Uncharacterized protein n=1 Tax=Trichonephila inaurata madagascariensis TaxID=2747483 RepID=A0A8X7CRG7_9ARAC|nr:hypothetical protein TNIN_311971 [Trichonephila inaurata madagascariensis]
MCRHLVREVFDFKKLSLFGAHVADEAERILFFRDTHSNILSKACYDNKKRDPEEERLRIVEAAAAIIREDIRSSVVETKSYPPPSKMLIKENKGR